MNRRIKCNVEILAHQQDEACIISLRYNDLDHAIVLIDAFRLSLISTLMFTNQNDVVVTVNRSDCRADNRELILHYSNQQYYLPDTWLDALLSVFLKTKLFSWSACSHIDIDMESENKSITLCVLIEAPL